MERIAQASKIKRVRRDDIIGKDARDQEDVREATRYLTEQRIIDPRNYFKSKTVINAFPRLGKMISIVDEVTEKHSGKFVLSILGLTTLTGIACVKYLSGLEQLVLFQLRL